MRDDRSRLADMIEAIANIENYAVFGRERCIGDELIRVYIIHHLQVIGEAGSKLSTDLRSRHPEIPWPKVLGIRHILVDDYFRVDYEIVWGVVEKDLPALKSQLHAVLSELVPG